MLQEVFLFYISILTFQEKSKYEQILLAIGYKNPAFDAKDIKHKEQTNNSTEFSKKEYLAESNSYSSDNLFEDATISGKSLDYEVIKEKYNY